MKPGIEKEFRSRNQFGLAGFGISDWNRISHNFFQGTFNRSASGYPFK
jgi:hypothetical protein